MGTHCVPNGVLGTGELPVPPVSSANIATLIGDPPYRGVMIYLHGGFGFYDDDLPTWAEADVPGGFFPSYQYSFQNEVLDEGWILVQPNYTENRFENPGAMVEADIENDPDAPGTRYVQQWLHHWDHIVIWIQNTFGTNFPILLWGGSWGGWHALHICTYRLSTIIGAIIGSPATILSNVTDDIIGVGVTITDSSGLDVGTTALNDCDVPTLVQYGTADAFVGWGIPGQGTCEEPYSLPESNTDLIIVNAQAEAQPCTRLETADAHSFPEATKDAYIDWLDTSDIHTDYPRSLTL
jgi:hypothetical protein